MSVAIVPTDLETSFQRVQVYKIMHTFMVDLSLAMSNPPHIDIAHAINTAQSIARDGRLIAALAYDRREVVGLIAAVHGPGFLTPKIIAEELAFYVLPERRKTGAGLSLLRWLVKEAGARGVEELYLGSKHPEHEKRVDTVYTRLGATRQHIVYRRDL